jgi:hypothetical protein
MLLKDSPQETIDESLIRTAIDKYFRSKGCLVAVTNMTQKSPTEWSGTAIVVTPKKMGGNKAYGKKIRIPVTVTVTGVTPVVHTLDEPPQ